VLKDSDEKVSPLANGADPLRMVTTITKGVRCVCMSPALSAPLTTTYKSRKLAKYWKSLIQERGIDAQENATFDDYRNSSLVLLRTACETETTTIAKRLRRGASDDNNNNAPSSKKLKKTQDHDDKDAENDEVTTRRIPLSDRTNVGIVDPKSVFVSHSISNTIHRSPCLALYRHREEAPSLSHNCLPSPTSEGGARSSTFSTFRLSFPIN
ncbi:7509_t:CDS:2, partial [Ambispora leptoticha]